MDTSKTLLIGATGLVGGLLIAAMRERPLTILARRAIDDLPDRHALRVAPPERWDDVIAAEAPSTLICCLGTTIKQAGSGAAFRAVDHDLVLTAARSARLGDAARMIAVSSVGAAAASRNFYLRTKGEVEEGLRGLGFDGLDILRPGLLIGERAGAPRPGEAMAMLAAPMTDALLWGSLRRYRSIPAASVAKAIAALVARPGGGTHIHENDAIRALAD